MATRLSLHKTRFALIGALLVGFSAFAGCDSDMDPDPGPGPDLGDPVTPDREVIDANLTAKPESLKSTSLRGTRYLGNSTGISGCSGYDYSHYEADTNGTQLHVVGIYEPAAGTGGDVQVHVTRAGESVLILSSYEATNWVVTADPGVTLERIVLTGYDTSTIIAPAGVPLVQVDQLGYYSGYTWPSYRTTGLVDAAEAYSGLTLTSFRGCYNPDTFQIDDVGVVEPPHTLTNQGAPMPIPGCEAIATESAYCLTTDSLTQSATMLGLDSETSCGNVPLPTDLVENASLGWRGDYLYTCQYDMGLIRMSLVDGTVDVAPIWCEAVTSYNDDLLAFVVLDEGEPFPQLVRFNSFNDAATRNPAHVFALEPWASRLATNGEQAYFSWHSAAEVLTSELLDGAPITPIALGGGYDDWIMGLDVLDDGRMLIGGWFSAAEDVYVFDAATGAATGALQFDGLEGIGGLDCVSTAPAP